MKIHEIREVPRYLRQRAGMPVARFELVSSLDDGLVSVALDDVVLLDPEDTMEEVKDRAAQLARFREKGLLTTRYDLHTRLEGMPKHKKVCHGDFNPSNIIITADGTPYIIDWSHATQGNASADAARTYLLFCLEGDRETAEKYLDLFCKKSDTAKQYVQKWMPIVAASQSVKAIAEERSFLLRWVDVVDYQ